MQMCFLIIQSRGCENPLIGRLSEFAAHLPPSWPNVAAWNPGTIVAAGMVRVRFRFRVRVRVGADVRRLAGLAAQAALQQVREDLQAASLAVGLAGDLPVRLPGSPLQSHSGGSSSVCNMLQLCQQAPANT